MLSSIRCTCARYELSAEQGKATKRKSNTSVIMAATRDAADKRQEADNQLRQELRHQHNEKMSLLRSFLETMKK